MFNKYEFLISATVYFKQEDNQPETGRICSIQLSVPGPRIFASSNEQNFELAVKETISDLERQLEKKKQSFKAH